MSEEKDPPPIKSRKPLNRLLLVVSILSIVCGFFLAMMTVCGSSPELTFDWYEARSLDDVAESLRKRGFTIYRKQIEGEFEERIDQVVARHENYRPGLLVRTGMVIKVSSRDASDIVDKVEFFYFYVGP